MRSADGQHDEQSEALTDQIFVHGSSWHRRTLYRDLKPANELLDELEALLWLYAPDASA